MKSIKVNILGKFYSIKVQVEDEQMMYHICDYINNRFEDFSTELKGQPEATITALALLSIGEDLFIERKKQKSESLDPELGNRLSNLLTVIKQANSDI